MKTALFTSAILLFAGWCLGFFLFNAGVFIHVLIMMAAITVMQAIIITPRPRG